MTGPETGAAKSRPETVTSPQRRQSRGIKLSNPRKYRGFLWSPAKLPVAATGWWARQDLNLRPDRYERPALTAELRALLRGYTTAGATDQGMRIPPDLRNLARYSCDSLAPTPAHAADLARDRLRNPRYPDQRHHQSHEHRSELGRSRPRHPLDKRQSQSGQNQRNRIEQDAGSRSKRRNEITRHSLPSTLRPTVGAGMRASALQPYMGLAIVRPSGGRPTEPLLQA